MEWIYILLIGVLAGGLALALYAWARLRRNYEQVHGRLIAADNDNSVLRERLSASGAEAQRLETQYALQFENLANRIFDAKSKQLTENNKTHIEALLRPLGQHITDFRTRLDTEAKERVRLETEIKNLHQISNVVSSQANNLASALRGNSKVRGDWGETILERLLEHSGLQKGVHFTVQENFKTGDGANVRPDVVLVLPDDKRIVIDSKVSLADYLRYYEAPENDTAAREAALQGHARSLRAHIDNLAGHDYHTLVQGSPEFVILFVPNEAAYMAAMQADAELWNYAYAKGVILSSPTNLLAIMKLVRDLWQRDAIDRNARDIAERGGRLYDKFVSFVESFSGIGVALRRASDSYETALKQLSEGNGHLVGQAQKLHELGVKATKRMPEKYLRTTQIEESHIADNEDDSQQ